MKNEKPPRPPKGLSETMKAWWNHVNNRFFLEPHHQHLLRLACESYDRCQQAKKILDELGLTYTDKYDCPHPRPENVIEKQSRLDFARLVKQLNLDVEEPEPCGRRPGYTPKQTQ